MNTIKKTICLIGASTTILLIALVPSMDDTLSITLLLLSNLIFLTVYVYYEQQEIGLIKNEA